MDKELTLIKTQTQKFLSNVSSLIIKTSDDYAKADEIRTQIKQIGKTIKEKKDDITRPINESLKKIRELFKPIETTHEQAVEIIENKMLTFRRAEEIRIKEEKAKLASKVESGYMKAETAIAKMELKGDVKTNLKLAGVKTSVRKLARVKIINEKDIPREYLIVNEKLVLEALKSGKVVQGAELYYEEVIA